MKNLEEQMKTNCRAKKACMMLLDWSWNHPNSSALTYAHDYARWAVICPSEELPTQLPYVLTNISHWRGETATSVRTTLKECIAFYKSN